MKSKNAGLYIHIPFCRSKCPYCDFYSLRLDESAANVYTDTLIHRIPALAAKYNITADTVYIGGGTPVGAGSGEAQQNHRRGKGVFFFRMRDNC